MNSLQNGGGGGVPWKYLSSSAVPWIKPGCCKGERERERKSKQIGLHAEWNLKSYYVCTSYVLTMACNVKANV